MRIDLPLLHIRNLHLMMIDDRHILRRQTGHIAGAILTVHGDQQPRRLTRRFLLRIRPDISYVYNGDVQFVHHQQQIGFMYLASARIDEPNLFAQTCKIPVQCKAGGDSVRVRIVVTLDRNRLVML